MRLAASAGWFYFIVSRVSGKELRQLVNTVFASVKKWRRLAGLLLGILSLSFTSTALSAPCAVSASTLDSAKASFAQLCSAESREDCDYIGNLWYCSSNQITNNALPAGLIGASTTTGNSQSAGGAAAATNSGSTGPCLDPDGDGYGWNGASCRVTATNTAATGSSGSSGGSGNASTSGAGNVSSAECIDPDGDGWGWNGASCKVAGSSSAGQTSAGSQSAGSGSSNAGGASGAGPCLDPDGDGWGWNGASCRVSSASSQSTSNSGSGNSNGVVRASDITDLILLTGQSNALGASTAYDARLDSANDHVFAFTNTGWQQANLNQVWDRGWHPRNDPATDPSNNLLLHFGKRVVSLDNNRVVGFVLVSAPGAAISNWDYNGDFYRTVRARVLEAINQLPHKSRLDGILWHQGETDAEDRALYGSQLYALIDNFRSENWFSNGRPFICGEIAKRGGVNNQLNRLNSDGDSTTACVSAANVETKTDNSHFTAVGLREIGRRYGDQYYQMTR